MAKSVTKKEFAAAVENSLACGYGVSASDATYSQLYKAVATVVNNMLVAKNGEYQKSPKANKGKKVYYLCMEFLMGRSLKNALFNLDLYKVFEETMSGFGVKPEAIFEQESDAGLGNGGLGRLAACYLDGLANQGYNAMGYSIRYEYGIFKQKIVDGWQTELPDFWLPGGRVWLNRREEDRQEVHFGGSIDSTWDGSYHNSIQRDYQTVFAVPYDLMVPSVGGDDIAVLRLWASEAPGIDMSAFNEGDYLRAVEQDALAGVISKILYPSDNHSEGKLLRLKQQYFLVSASIQDIIGKHLKQYGTLDNLGEQVAIHINDTHPTLAIPETMRILLDECGYSWDEAYALVEKTFAYTNHTVMAEALECWPVDLYQRLLPRIYEITKEIDNRFRAKVWERTQDAGKVEKMAIVSGNSVRMANMCVAVCHSVNGVSALHSEILKETIFKDFYEMEPTKFKNVTNGIAHRRWLCQANPTLCQYLDKKIGNGYVKNASELAKLKDYADDDKVLAKVAQIKRENKVRFAKYIKEKQGIDLNPDSLFDVQVKRLHEYKRQLLNAVNILSRYLQLKENPDIDMVPHTYIFGAKAASGYFMAKKIIEFICTIADIINNDPDIGDKMKVVYIEDYNVSTAEVLMPSADISEQISLAGTEASGTGNMKLMMNGAVTLGTMDGANVEIFEAVGEDNIIIFGMSTPEVNELKEKGYSPSEYLNANENAKKVVSSIMAGIGGKEFPEIVNALANSDPYMVMADFADYQRAQAKIDELYKDEKKFARMGLMNIASSGIFAADRSIDDYATHIWGCKN